MQMIYDLSSFSSDIERQFISLESFLGGDAFGGINELRDHVAMIRFEMRNGLNVLFRNYQDMNRRFGLLIGKREDLIIFGDDCFGRYLAMDDFTKNAVHT